MVGTLLRSFIRLHVILGAVCFFVIAAIVLVSGVSFAVSFVIVVGLLELLILGLYIAWVVHAVNTYGGVPFPGILGLMGVEVVDAERIDRPTNGWPGKPGWEGAVSAPPTLSTTPPRLAKEGVLSAKIPPGNVRRVCLRCGAVTEGQDSEYCRACGAPFAPEGTPA